MNLRYIKISEVQVWHDYYLAKDSDDNDYWLDSYSVLNDLDIIPTPQCAELLKNHKIVFKKTATGFQLFARAIPSAINNGEFQTFIFIDPSTKLDFFIVVKNAFFFNFTNIRLTDKSKLYYFTNKGKAEIDGKFHMTEPHPSPIIPFVAEMLLSDIIENGGNLHELKNNVAIGNGLDAANSIVISDNQRSYVSTKDALPQQKLRYDYFDANNPNPGELVQFTLTDIHANIMDLGVNHLGKPHSKYRAPTDAGKPLNHTIDFSNIPQGKYTLDINRVSNIPPETFYLLDNKIEPNAFGNIELMAGDNLSGVFNYQGNESIIAPKVFSIRFKNRTTIWKYYKKDGSEITDPNDEKFNSLTQQPSGFEIAGNVLSDPSISMIYPEKDPAGNIIKIYSETHLNQ